MRASPLRERSCAVTSDVHSGVQVDGLSRRAILSVPTTGAEAMLYLTSLKALGAHNANNAAAAALLALGLDVGVNESHLQEAVATLHPLPHRMEVGAKMLPSSPTSISISHPLLATRQGKGSEASTQVTDVAAPISEVMHDALVPLR